MYVQSLADLLRTLGRQRATQLLPDEEDRAAALRLADAIDNRWGGRDKPQVVIVVGPDTDPVVNAVHDLEQVTRSITDELSTFDDHLTFIRAELTRRRHHDNQHPETAAQSGL